MPEQEIEVGFVEDYFAHVGVVAVKLAEDGIKLGDTLHFKGHTTDLVQEISSIQIEHQFVKEAKKGKSVGIKVNDRIRKHDKVYKVLLKE